MNAILEYLTGMNKLTDQVIATDFLITAKSGVRNYAMAITETASPDIRTMLTNQLKDAIDTHERIVAYMMDRGWYHPWDVEEQLRLDRQNIQTALNVPTM